MSQQIKRVCVIGYQGKMGRLAVDFITHQQGYEIAGLVGRQDDVVEVIKNHRPDMVLDLSLHDVVYDHAVRVIQTQTPLVIGASGLDKHQLAQLMALCERLVSSCLVVPNFSISACLMMRFAGLAAPFFEDINILDCHHKAKRDRPSGTAYAMARELQDAKVRSGLQQSEKVDIHSLRSSAYLAAHEVILSNQGDTISIKQTTSDRRAYEPGILFALSQVTSVKGLVVGLESMIV